jgi:hypothetical protein
MDSGGGTKSDAQRAVREEEKKYPEPTMFGTTPAHGFFVRHVCGLEMDGIKIEHTNQDGRPVFVLDDVDGADLGRIKAASDAGVPASSLNQVRDFSVVRSKPVADTDIDVVGKRRFRPRLFGSLILKRNNEDFANSECGRVSYVECCCAWTAERVRRSDRHWRNCGDDGWGARNLSGWERCDSRGFDCGGRKACRD